MSGLGPLNILEIGTLIFAPIEEQIQWMQAHNLLSMQPNYAACGTAMRFQVRNDVQDKRR